MLRRRFIAWVALLGVLLNVGSVVLHNTMAMSAELVTTGVGDLICSHTGDRSNPTTGDAGGACDHCQVCLNVLAAAAAPQGFFIFHPPYQMAVLAERFEARTDRHTRRSDLWPPGRAPPVSA